MVDMQTGSALGKLRADSGIVQDSCGGGTFVANFLQMLKSKNAHNKGERRGQED